MMAGARWLLETFAYLAVFALLIGGPFFPHYFGTWWAHQSAHRYRHWSQAEDPQEQQQLSKLHEVEWSAHQSSGAIIGIGVLIALAVGLQWFVVRFDLLRGIWPR